MLPGIRAVFALDFAAAHNKNLDLNRFRAGCPIRRMKTPPKQEAPALAPADRQRQAFDSAMRAFNARDFRSALDGFREAATGPGRDVAHSAKLHLRMCEQRIAAGTPRLETADDHYHYAIARMNQRQLQEAEKHFRQALALNGHLEYVYYGLALCRGLQGDLRDCAQFLEKAIGIEPQNKVAARKDPDFRELIRQSPVREVLA
jgi:tetratricopeptide (TPR) repeat protein